MNNHPERLVQFSTEMAGFQLNLDGDHRKRRRNRTTQSCLNCHTSKRKCDRKRPCSRCIQLGLTGLCVYEVDDPAIRDDPNVDEVTKLRNRIAELESLVRELRGKPHPRWVDNGAAQNAAVDDLSEKWHTRAFKKPAGVGQQLTIKTEPDHTSDYLSPHRRPTMYSHPSQDGHYSPSPPLDAGSSSSPPRADSDQSYYALHQNGTPTGLSCRCLSNPSVTSQLSTLTRALHSAHGFLDRSAEHNPEGCVVINRIADLNNLLLPNDSYNNTPFVGNGSHHSHQLPPHPNQQFSPLPSPHNPEFDHYPYSSTTRTPDSEIAPDNTSTSSGTSYPHTPHQHISNQWYPAVPSPTGSGTVNPVMSGYNPYFPTSPAIGDVQQQAAGQGFL